MTWGTLPDYSTFERARRKEVGRRLARLIVGKAPDSLLSLEEVRDQLGLYEQWYAGIQVIPLDKIVGSVDRAADFDRSFLPKKPAMETRWKRVEQAFQHEGFPPIVAFKVGDAYFIEDGHHRVAIARQRREEFIDAEVTEVKTPVPITSATEASDIVHLGMRQWFMRETSLDRVRPDATIEPSRPHAYAELLDIVHAVGFELALERQRIITAPMAAAHWFDDLYQPTVSRIRAGKLPAVFPRATETDLYLQVHAQHRELVAVTKEHDVESTVTSTEQAASGNIKAKARLAIEEAKDKIAPPAKSEKDDAGQ